MNMIADIPLLSFRDVWKTYGHGEAQVHALAGVDLSIARGEFVAIMGPSGSGKSTAMNIIGCLDMSLGAVTLLKLPIFRHWGGADIFRASASRGFEADSYYRPDRVDHVAHPRIFVCRPVTVKAP